MSTTDPEREYDIAVVGAGIVGLAVARELQRRNPDGTVVVLDKHETVGHHQTGRNSGVIHAGIYYKPGSLKARLCVEGARELYAFCDEHDVAYERCGKVIVATDPSELGRLDDLEARGRANGVPGLRRLTPEELQEVEPECRGIAALHSPNTGIVDYPAVARAMAADITASGGELALGCAVSNVERSGARVVIDHSRGRTVARNAVFCAGLWADRLAVSAGANPDPRIIPFRGAYMKLRPERTDLVKGLIYPVPNPELPFLGVHLTKHVSGDVLLGPTALLVGALDAYKLRSVRARDMAATLAWPGTWRMMRKFWKTGISEMRMAASKHAFVEANRRFVPALRDEDVIPGPAGVRAQAVGRDGSLVDDFVISDTPGAIHVRNAPSPAATSSLAIGAMIADRAQEAFGTAGGRVSSVA